MHILSIWEITIEVSVMILLIGLIRRLFHMRLTSDFQYFLWIFVALRILLPVGMTVEVSLPQSLRETAVAWIFAENSTNGTDEGLTSTDENGTAAEENGSADGGTEAEALRLSDTSGAGLYTDFIQSDAEQGTDSERTDSEALKEIGAYDAGGEVQSSESFSSGLKESSGIFFRIWIAGCLSLGLYMLIGNIRLFYRLKKERRLIGGA